MDFEERASLESLFQSKIQDLILISGYILEDFAQGIGKGLEINGEFFYVGLVFYRVVVLSFIFSYFLTVKLAG